MGWGELTIVFVVSHLAGDFLLQTDWQATHKLGGLGRDRVARRALFSHVATYILCFAPALVWVGDEIGALGATAIGLVIAVPHLVVDDIRLLRAYLVRVKGTSDPPPVGLMVMTDQSIHLICLWGAAVLAEALR